METVKKLLLHPAVPIAEAVIDGIIMIDMLQMCAFFGPVLIIPLIVSALALAVTGIAFLVKPEYRATLRWVLRIVLAVPICLYLLIYAFLGILFFIAKSNA